METSLRPADIELQLKIVDAVYGAVLEPDQYTVVIAAASEIFHAGAEASDQLAPIGAQLASLRAPFTSATRLFALARPEWRSRLEDLLEAKPFAAMAVSDTGRVAMMNRAAVQMFGRLESVADLPLRADAHADVGTFLGNVGRAGTAAPLVVVGWHPAETELCCSCWRWPRVSGSRSTTSASTGRRAARSSWSSRPRPG